MKKLLLTLHAPFLYLNMAGLAGLGLWLGSTAQWRLAGTLAFALVISPFLLPLLMIPSGIFTHFMLRAQARGEAGRERLFFRLGLAYILVFLAAWSGWIFSWFEAVTPNAAGAFIGASCAMMTLLLWIGGDKENTFILVLVETVQVALLVLCVERFFTTVPFSGLESFGFILALLALAAYMQQKEFGH